MSIARFFCATSCRVGRYATRRIVHQEGHHPPVRGRISVLAPAGTQVPSGRRDLLSSAPLFQAGKKKCLHGHRLPPPRPRQQLGQYTLAREFVFETRITSEPTHSSAIGVSSHERHASPPGSPAAARRSAQKGLYKRERQIQTPQGSDIAVGGKHVINFCANNYLGLASHPAILAAAREGLDKYGYGMASVRFICGTQDSHKQLESTVARFLGKDDAILYSSCWDANGGVFETILGEEDAVLSDELNHASIIDGVRLCKAKRFRYRNGDMAELEKHLQEAKSCRLRLIVTDGVFSMDGSLAKLPDICELADRHDAAVMVDDSHATGILGPGGRGTAEHLGVQDRIDIFTSTLGKTLGGAAGGFTCAAPRSWTSCASAPGRICSPTPCRRPSSWRRSRRWSWSRSRASCAIGYTPTRRRCAPVWRRRASPSSQAITPSCR